MLTLTEAKLQLNIDEADTSHDVELQVYVDAAVKVVERHTGLVGDLRTIANERHDEPPTARLWLHHRPVRSVASVQRVDGSMSWDPANLDVDEDEGALLVVSGPLFSGLLEVTYEAGHVEVPKEFNLAARIIVQHLWQTQRGAWAGRGVRTVLEDSFENLVGGGRGYAIPNAALELLGEPAPVVL